MSRLSDAAKKTTTLSELMTGRDKISTEEIIRNYPNGITVIGVDMVNTTQVDRKTGEILPSTYPILVFKEDSTKYFFGGTAMNNIVNDWIALCGGLEEVNTELGQTGGVTVKMELKRTSNGNQFTNVIVVD